MIGQCFDNKIVASSDNEWFKWPIKKRLPQSGQFFDTKIVTSTDNEPRASGCNDPPTSKCWKLFLGILNQGRF